MFAFLTILTTTIADATMAIGPLAIAGIGAGVSALGGLAANAANRDVNVEVPDALRQNIESLQNKQFFAPQVQRAINEDQGAFNLRSNLNAQGVDSAAILSTQQESLANDQADNAVQMLGQLEGLRLNALGDSIGQLSQLNQANAQLDQQRVNNRLGIINSAVSGIGGSATQGLGAAFQQQNLDRLLQGFGSDSPTGQVGGQGFSVTNQFSRGGMLG